MQHNESSTLHTLAPSGELIKGLVKAVKVALNEKYEFFPRKIGALPVGGIPIVYGTLWTHGIPETYYAPRNAVLRLSELRSPAVGM